MHLIVWFEVIFSQTIVSIRIEIAEFTLMSWPDIRELNRYSEKPHCKYFI